MDSRPIKFNKSGKYNLDFIDWNNECERVGEIACKIENGEPVSDPEEEERVRKHMELDELKFGVVLENYPIVPKNRIPLNKECYICLQAFTKNKIPLNKECYICLQNFTRNKNVRQLPCEHIFCEECLKPWLKKNSICPICKYELKHQNENEEEDNDNYDF